METGITLPLLKMILPTQPNLSGCMATGDFFGMIQ
jgi:hypothetical protein